jgi:hypothetical protein
MNKIVYVPLDERPCNYHFPNQIFNQGNVLVITPPEALMGYKKSPADVEGLSKWLLSTTKDAFGLVVALDTLIYGGIVPSRLHYLDAKILKCRLQILATIKKNNPEIIIYGFSLIMRCPQYNSEDEEPNYFLYHGKDIHNYGYYHHLQELNILSEADKQKLDKITIPKDYLADFKNRRQVNCQLNIEALSLVEQEIISFFTIPQDDSSKYGWTAKDQILIREVIKQKHLMNMVYMYPGADEAGCVLMSRMVCSLNKLSPKVLIKYPNANCEKMIPSLEDRYLDTTVKYHILACGGLVVNSLKECDVVLFINAPTDYMRSSFSKEKPGRGLEVLRNVVESMEFLDYAFHEKGKPIIVGDITYGNGSDLEIYHLLAQKNLLLSLAGFGGWNTASNAIGCAIAMGYSYLVNKKTAQHLNFLVSRYVEDIGYCGYVRQMMMKEVLPLKRGFSYFNARTKNGVIAKEILKRLKVFVTDNMKELSTHLQIKKLELPWRRLYEIDLNVKYQEKNN